MDLFNFEVKQIYAKKEAPKPIEKRIYVTPKTKTQESHFHNSSPSKQEYLNRLIILKEQIQPYKHLNDDAIKEICVEEFETVRCAQIQIALLQKKLK